MLRSRPCGPVRQQRRRAGNQMTIVRRTGSVVASRRLSDLPVADHSPFAPAMSLRWNSQKEAVAMMTMYPATTRNACNWLGRS